MTVHSLAAYLEDGTPRPRRRRAGRVYAGKLRKLQPKEPAGLDHRRKVEATVSRELGWAQRVDALALARDCPSCNAEPGRSCTRPTRKGGRVTCPTHHARLEGLDDTADG